MFQPVRLLCLAWLLPIIHALVPEGYGSQQARCTKLCSILNGKYPGLLDYEGESGYISPYWSLQQANTKPACRFNPKSAQDVSAAIVAVRKTGCPFAVKSGGHAAFSGGSNIQGGLTIDLRNLNEVTVSDDEKTTRLGTGLHWEDVYKPLDDRNLSVVGGRSGDVGVGGLTLGGGISFFSGAYGWACDNVKNYEVVLADGRIVNASPHQYPDLFYALRGGGNNFGVVTRMDLNTFSQGLMLGGSNIYTADLNGSIYDAFYWANKQSSWDPKAALIVATGCVKGSGCFFSNNYNHMEPIPVTDVPLFRNFTKFTPISSTERISYLSDFTKELKDGQPPGSRQAFITFTVKNDAQLLKDMYNEIFYPSLQPILNGTTMTLGTFAAQPITIPIIQNFAQNGGNALGITEADGPLTLMNMDFVWSSAEEDNMILRAQQDIVKRCIGLAKSRGLGHRFIYQNYAYITQNVFDGYGSESKSKLLKIQKKYDPQNLFTNLQPGYFKLRRPQN